MEVQEMINRLRLLSELMVPEGPVKRDKQLRREIEALFKQIPPGEQEAKLKVLTAAFPVWPPDVPPPQPLTDAEMVDRLRMRMDHSEEDRNGVESLLREREISCGLSAEDVRKLRSQVAIDPTLEPVVGRVVDALLVSLRTLSDIDRVFRLFLQNNELGFWGLQIPRFRDTVMLLLTRSDSDPLRHNDLERLNSACSLLSRMATMLVQWPPSYVAKLAEQLAPNRIEQVVPRKFMSANYEGFWNEFIRRMGSEKDEEGCKAELLEIFKRILNETASL